MLTQQRMPHQEEADYFHFSWTGSPPESKLKPNKTKNPNQTFQKELRTPRVGSLICETMTRHNEERVSPLLHFVQLSWLWFRMEQKPIKLETQETKSICLLFFILLSSTQENNTNEKDLEWWTQQWWMKKIASVVSLYESVCVCERECVCVDSPKGLECVINVSETLCLVQAAILSPEVLSEHTHKYT